MDGNSTVAQYFTARAVSYNRSSRWCNDAALDALMLEMTAPGKGDCVLDVACGTGLVSRIFHGGVSRVVGLDITPAMLEQARAFTDETVLGSAEDMPFADQCFDLVVCRQGIQFMDDRLALRQMWRVLRPGGKVCVVALCAYGEEDRAEYFEVLRLRNPARRNFYAFNDLESLLRKTGFEQVTVARHVSLEDVDGWSEHSAIDETRREAIRRVYRRASRRFLDLHAARFEGERISDQMLFGVAVGIK